MTLPLYPKTPCETVINEPGHIKGYFANHCPGSGTAWDFKVAPDWKVISCTTAGFGTHGCCPTCTVILIELKHIDFGKEPIEPVPINNHSETIFIALLVVGVAWLLRR